MDTLQRHTPLSGQDGATELWKIANRFEEKIFYAASDQHDYLRKISLKMLHLETRTQNSPNDALPTSFIGTNSVRPSDSVGSGDSLQQVGQPGIDQADIVWSKMQTVKDKYLQDMQDLLAALTRRSQQPIPEEQLQKLTHYKNVVGRMIPYLTASKGSLPKEFKQDKAEAFEKLIVRIMETFKSRQQQGNLGRVQAVQQPEQASRILQADVQQQTPQMNSLPTAPTEHTYTHTQAHTRIRANAPPLPMRACRVRRQKMRAPRRARVGKLLRQALRRQCK